MLNVLFLHQNVFGFLGGIPINARLSRGLYRCQRAFLGIPFSPGCFERCRCPRDASAVEELVNPKLLPLRGFIGSTIVHGTQLRPAHSYLAWAAGIGANFLVVTPKEDARFPVGNCNCAGRTAACDEGACLVCDYTLPTTGRVFELSPRAAHRSVHETLQRMVA